MASSTLEAKPAATRQRAIWGRPIDGARHSAGAGQVLVDLVVDRVAEHPQAIDDPLEAGHAEFALALERRLERFVAGVHTQAQDVELAVGQAQVPGQAVDLHSGDELERQRRGTGRAQFARTGKGVMVRQGEDPDSRGRGLGHEIGGLEHSVGAPAVAVEVEAARVRGDDRVAGAGAVRAGRVSRRGTVAAVDLSPGDLFAGAAPNRSPTWASGLPGPPCEGAGLAAAAPRPDSGARNPAP